MLTMPDFRDKIIFHRNEHKLGILIRRVDAPLDAEPEGIFGVFPSKNVSEDETGTIHVNTMLLIAFSHYLDNEDYTFEFITPGSHTVVDGKIMPVDTAITSTNSVVH